MCLRLHTLLWCLFTASTTQAFITHAGQASFVQAIYGRVPMLAIPCFVRRV